MDSFSGPGAVIQACKQGSSARSLKYLAARDTESFWKEAASLAATCGHVHVLRWLSEFHSDRCEWGPAVMNGAALCGHLDVVQWLHENRSEGCTVHAMDSAVRNRDWAMVQWLHTNRSEGCSRGAMDWAAAAGNLSLVRWLHTHRSEGCTTRAMDWAAAAGHLETVQWLHNNRIEGDAGRALRTAASSGHLDVVQWLHATRGMEQSGDMDSLAALEIAEMHNHRVVADWLQAHLKSSECELGHQATFQANPPEQARCHLMWEYPVLYVVRWIRRVCATSCGDHSAHHM
ncbi:Ankyrin repeats (many copies) [Phytophthora infestans]|uniref:Ankyrin repeats (Many copies) n=1 Tax=Phytophthora infestans TaxID=4787 RepID=A0A8S9V023_PHYIN|nr:Ankyrin repeats (many copies) [Phytophthora infestans]